MKKRGVSVAEFADVQTAEQRERDLHMLTELLRDDAGVELREGEGNAFVEMQTHLLAWEEPGWRAAIRFEKLTQKQRSWVESACERNQIDTVPPRLRKPVPRGREVPIAPVLQNLPKRPPGRR